MPPLVLARLRGLMWRVMTSCSLFLLAFFSTLFAVVYQRLDLPLPHLLATSLPIASCLTHFDAALRFLELARGKKRALVRPRPPFSAWRWHM